MVGKSAGVSVSLRVIWWCAWVWLDHRSTLHGGAVWGCWPSVVPAAIGAHWTSACGGLTICEIGVYLANMKETMRWERI